MHKINFTFIWLILFSSVLTYGQWVQSDGPIEVHIKAFYQNGGTLWVGIQGGLYRSNDKGNSWKMVGNEMESRPISAITASGANLLVGNDDGLYRSQDEGQTWQLVLKGDTYIAFKCLLSHGGEVYAGTESGKIFKSQDSGATWKGPILGVENVSINALAASGSSIIAGTSQGLLISTDNGNSWVGIDSSFNIVGPINCITTSGNDVYVGANSIYRSPDNGKNWKLITGSASFDTTGHFSALTIHGSNLFAGTVEGLLFRTLDKGKNWKQVNFGPSITCMASVDSTLFIGTTPDGLFKSANNGDDWIKSNHGLLLSSINSIVSDVFDLYTATKGRRIYRSMNSGKDWSLMDIYTPVYKVFSVNCLIVRQANGIFAGLDLGVVKRVNSSFYPANKGIETARVKSMIFFGTEIFAAASGDGDVEPWQGGVYKSVDNAASWAQANTGMPGMAGTSLATKGDTLFVGGHIGIYRSGNHGNSWQAVNEGLGGASVKTIAVLKDRLFIGTNLGVFVSTNNGNTWSKANEGLPVIDTRFWLPTKSVLTLNTFGNKFIYAGTDGNGVYRYYEPGNKWIPVNQGLEMSSVSTMTLFNSRLFAGTENGIWSLPYSDAVAINPELRSRRGNLHTTLSAVRAGKEMQFYRKKPGSAKIEAWNSSGRKIIRSNASEGIND